MNRFYPYIFGYEDGLPPEIAKQKMEAEAFEKFLEKLLGEESYKRRNQMRLMDKAVGKLVDDILRIQI